MFFRVVTWLERDVCFRVVTCGWREMCAPVLSHVVLQIEYLSVPPMLICLLIFFFLLLLIVHLWFPTRRHIWLSSRPGLGRWSHQCRVWSTVQWSHDCPLWRCCNLSQLWCVKFVSLMCKLKFYSLIHGFPLFISRAVLGDGWPTETHPLVHNSNCHQVPHESWQWACWQV